MPTGSIRDGERRWAVVPQARDQRAQHRSKEAPIYAALAQPIRIGTMRPRSRPGVPHKGLV